MKNTLEKTNSLTLAILAAGVASLKKTKSLALAILATGLASLTILPSSARADDWFGGTSIDWNDSLNWSGTAVPNGVEAIINTGTGNVPLISADVTGNPRTVQITGGGVLNHTAGSVSVTGTGGDLDYRGGPVLVGGGWSSATYNIADTTTTGGALTGYGTGSGSVTTGGWGDIRVAAGYWWDYSNSVMNINTSGTVHAQGQMIVAGRNGDVGTVNVDAGTVTLQGGWNGDVNHNTSMLIAVGSGTETSTGSLNMSGGTVTLNDQLVIGAGLAGATGLNVGSVTITGGTMTTDAASNDNWRSGVNMASGYNAGVGGTATVNLNGGTFFTLFVFSETGVTGTNVVSGTAGTSIFNFNGGTLKADAAPGWLGLMYGLTRANVRNGGAIIDTNGNDRFLNQVLEHSDIGGDAAIDGGLTKEGAGELQIGAANNFTGPVVVNSGTLYATTPDYAAGGFGDSSGITVNSGATLKANTNSLFNKFNTYSAGSLTVNAGGQAVTVGGQQFVGLVTLNGGELGSSGAIGADGSWTFGNFSSVMKLAVTDDSTVTAVQVAFYNGATIDVTTGKTLTFDGTIADSGTNATSVIVSGGDGTVVLNSINTYTGSTTVNNGTVQFNQPDASVVTLTGGLNVATSGTAVLTAHTGGAAYVKVLDITGLTIDGTTAFAGDGGKDLGGLASAAPVPEPGTIGLLAVGAIGGALLHRRNRKVGAKQ